MPRASDVGHQPGGAPDRRRARVPGQPAVGGGTGIEHRGDPFFSRGSVVLRPGSGCAARPAPRRRRAGRGWEAGCHPRREPSVHRAGGREVSTHDTGGDPRASRDRPRSRDHVTRAAGAATQPAGHHRVESRASRPARATALEASRGFRRRLDRGGRRGGGRWRVGRDHRVGELGVPESGSGGCRDQDDHGHRIAGVRRRAAGRHRRGRHDPPQACPVLHRARRALRAPDAGPASAGAGGLPVAGLAQLPIRGRVGVGQRAPRPGRETLREHLDPLLAGRQLERLRVVHRAADPVARPTRRAGEGPRDVHRRRDLHGDGRRGEGPDVCPARSGAGSPHRRPRHRGLVTSHDRRIGVDRRHLERRSQRADRYRRGIGQGVGG